MTKKDYELIAHVVESSRYYGLSDSQRFNLAHTFANLLEAQNPRFDQDKFLRACGVEVLSNITVINCQSHDVGEYYSCDHCPINPTEKVLPDENGKCSLCGLHQA